MKRLADHGPVRRRWAEERLVGDRAHSGEALVGAVAALRPGAIGIDRARPDRAALDGARPAAARPPGPVMMVAAGDDAGLAAATGSSHAAGRALPDGRPILRGPATWFRRSQMRRAEPGRTEDGSRRREVPDRTGAVPTDRRGDGCHVGAPPSADPIGFGSTPTIGPIEERWFAGRMRRWNGLPRADHVLAATLYRPLPADDAR